jgi:hypothetical protein
MEECEYVTHDIQGYDYMYIREDTHTEDSIIGSVFMFSKTTGEVVQRFTVDEYCLHWKNEVDTNTKVSSFYKKGYNSPRKSADSATNIATLIRLCADKTRHRKGQDAYLLDFIWSKSMTLTETELFKIICEHVVVWNYSVFDESTLSTLLGKDTKYTRRVYKALQDKGLIRVLSTKFDNSGVWNSFVKVHPRLYWKGRVSAWAVAVGEAYEYEDSIKLS